VSGAAVTPAAWMIVLGESVINVFRC